MKKILNINKIRRLYLVKGFSASKIGKIIGVSHKTIILRLNKMNIKIRHQLSYQIGCKHPKKEVALRINKRFVADNKRKGLDMEKIKKMYLEDKKSMQNIADFFKVDITTIRLRLVKIGIKIRSFEEVLKILWGNEDYCKNVMEGRKNSDKYNITRRKKISKFQQVYSKTPERKRVLSEGSKRAWKRKEYREKISRMAKERWRDPKYANKMLKSLLQRPTSYEKKISELCIENNLPFVYTGDGTFLIGHKNPDFVNKERKLAIEVYHNYFKVRDFGSCENYEKQRSEYFAKYGWDVIFIRTEEIEAKNWENVCLQKINKV